MGIIKEQKPFYANCFVLLVLVLTGIGILIVLFMLLFGIMTRSYQLECPECCLVFSVPA